MSRRAHSSGVARVAVPGLRFLRAFAEARAGAQAIEAALVLPVVAMLLFGIIEFGRALWIRTALQSAVEDAARCAAINTTACGSASAVQSYAVGRLAGISVPASNFSVTTPSCGHQVSVSYAFSSVVPQLVPLTLTLSARACHP